MHAQAWKVPTVLLAAVLVGACGRDAESAAADAGERVDAAAEATDAPAVREPAEPAAPEPADAASPASPAPAGSTAERVAPGSAADPAASGSRAGRTAPDQAVSSPPTTVVRTDPEPSVAPDVSLESRPEAGAEADEAPKPEPLTAPVGTRLSLAIEQELSTKVTRTGDTFAATVSEDVLGTDGMVLLRRGTHVRGRVLESYESPGSDRPATLAVAVEAVEIGDRIVPVSATVVEMEHRTEARDSDGRSAAKVGAGAVAGALLGKIIGGDGKDALKGAVAGGLAGAAVAHATRDGHATIPQGARMVIVLDEPLVVEPGALKRGW